MDLRELLLKIGPCFEEKPLEKLIQIIFFMRYDHQKMEGCFMYVCMHTYFEKTRISTLVKNFQVFRYVVSNTLFTSFTLFFKKKKVPLQVTSFNF